MTETVETSRSVARTACVLFYNPNSCHFEAFLIAFGKECEWTQLDLHLKLFLPPYYGEVVCSMCERMIFVNSKAAILIKATNN